MSERRGGFGVAVVGLLGLTGLCVVLWSSASNALALLNILDGARAVITSQKRVAYEAKSIGDMAGPEAELERMTTADLLNFKLERLKTFMALPPGPDRDRAVNRAFAEFVDPKRWGATTFGTEWGVRTQAERQQFSSL